MARHVEPEIDRHGRYQRLTRPPCDIGKTRAHVTRRKLAGRRSPADWDAWQAPTSQRRGEAMGPILIDRGAPAPPATPPSAPSAKRQAPPTSPRRAPKA